MMSMAPTSAPELPSAEVNFPNVPGMRCKDTRKVSVYPADGWIVTMAAPFRRTVVVSCDAVIAGRVDTELSQVSGPVRPSL